jgi:hypothetical protein
MIATSLCWNLRIAADLYIAAFLTPKTGGLPINHNTVAIPTTAHVWDALSSRNVYGPLVGRTQDLAGAARAFHWPLEFPDIMTAGGFDVVLGNPPWERIKLQEQEFFAAREPEIAEAPNPAAAARLLHLARSGSLALPGMDRGCSRSTIPGSPQRSAHCPLRPSPAQASRLSGSPTLPSCMRHSTASTSSP